MSKSKFWLVVALAAVLAACGSTSEEERLKEPVDLPDFTKTVSINTAWSKQIGEGGDRAFGFIQPTIYGENLYVANTGGKVFKLAKADGDLKWKTDLDETLVSGVAYGAGSVFVGLKNGVLVALNENDGIPQWRKAVGGEIMAPVAVAKGVVFVQTANGMLIGLKQDNGEEIWRTQSALPVLTVRGTSSPVVLDSLVVTGLANGKLVGIDITTGIERWDVRLAIASGDSDIERVVDVDIEPLVVGTRIIAGSYNGSIAMVDGANGQLFWQKDGALRGDISEGFGNIYVSSAAGELIAYDAASAKIKWVNEKLLRRGLGDTATWVNYAAVADYKGYLHIVAQRDGKIVGRKKIGDSLPRAPFVVSDNKLIVFNNDGRLSAFSIEADK